MSNSAPVVLSIIIPVVRFSKILEANLRFLIAQSLPEGEREIIIAYNNPEAPRIPEGLSKHCQVLCLNHFSRSKARNEASQKARGEFLLFLDVNSLLKEPNALEELLKIARVHPVIQLPVNMRPYSEREGIAGKYERLAYLRGSKRSWNVGGSQKTPMLDTAGAMLRKDIFLKLKGFDPRLERYEDRDLAKRLAKQGYEIWPAGSPMVTKIKAPTSTYKLLKKFIIDDYYRHLCLARQSWPSVWRQELLAWLNIFNPGKIKAVFSGQASLQVILYSTFVALTMRAFFLPSLGLIVLKRFANPHYRYDWGTEKIPFN